MKAYKLILVTHINNITHTIIADDLKVTCDGIYNFMKNKKIVASFPTNITAITEVTDFNGMELE